VNLGPGHIFLQNKRCSEGCKLTRAAAGTSASKNIIVNLVRPSHLVRIFPIVALILEYKFFMNLFLQPKFEGSRGFIG